MSLVTAGSSPDTGGPRPRRGGTGLRARVGMLLAATMSLVLVGTALAQSPSPEGSAAPATRPADDRRHAVAPHATGSTRPVVSVPDAVTLRLQDGIAAGNDGCNDYFAPYTIDGSALSIGQVGVTFPPLTCDEAAAAYEAAYFAALASVSSYLLLGSTLVLVDGAGAPILTYEAAPDSPVTRGLARRPTIATRRAIHRAGRGQRADPGARAGWHGPRLHRLRPIRRRATCSTGRRSCSAPGHRAPAVRLVGPPAAGRPVPGGDVEGPCVDVHLLRPTLKLREADGTTLVSLYGGTGADLRARMDADGDRRPGWRARAHDARRRPVRGLPR